MQITRSAKNRRLDRKFRNGEYYYVLFAVYPPLSFCNYGIKESAHCSQIFQVCEFRGVHEIDQMVQHWPMMLVKLLSISIAPLLLASGKSVTLSCFPSTDCFGILKMGHWIADCSFLLLVLFTIIYQVIFERLEITFWRVFCNDYVHPGGLCEVWCTKDVRPVSTGVINPPKRSARGRFSEWHYVMWFLVILLAKS